MLYIPNDSMENFISGCLDNHKKPQFMYTYPPYLLDLQVDFLLTVSVCVLFVQTIC